MTTKVAKLNGSEEVRFVSLVRGAFRAFIFFTAIICYFLTALPFYPLFFVNPTLMRKLIRYILSGYARFALWFMGIRVSLKGEREKEGNYLIVCNHLSYLDILVVCSYFPSCFVTSVEMRDTPFLGHICKLAGCVFVERRNKSNLSNEVIEITESLKQGLDVVIFPEATSTSGEEVIRFRRPLYKAAVDAGVSVLPLTLNYQEVDEIKVSLKNRDTVFWYGDMTFLDHIWGVWKSRSIKVQLTISSSISGDDYSQLATLSHEVVAANYQSII